MFIIALKIQKVGLPEQLSYQFTINKSIAMSFLPSPKGRTRPRRIETLPEYYKQDETQQIQQLKRRQDVHLQGSKVTSASRGKKMRLMPIKTSLFKEKQPKRSQGLESKRAKSHLGSDVQRMKGDISKIRHEIMAQRSKATSHNYPATQNQSDVMYSPTSEKKLLFKPFWNKGHSPQNSPKRTSLFQMDSPMQQQSNESATERSEEEDPSLFFPIIEKGRGRSRNKQKTGQFAQQRLREYFQMYRSQKQTKRRLNFRKAVHAVLFTIYLRNYNSRMRELRKLNFDKYVAQQLKERLLQLKELIIKHAKPFFTALLQQYNFDIRPHPKDDQKLRKEKLKYMKKLLNLWLQCLKEATARLVLSNEKYGYLLYYLCRHGSFSCFHSIYTAEQMNIMSVSELHGYMSADKWLQKSALVSLFLIKLTLYNVLFDWPMLKEMLALKSSGTVFTTVQLVGNVLYELFIDIQDDLMEQASPVYRVGNWGKLKHRFDFRLAQNMSVKEGVYQKGELISGLEDHNTIKEMFGTRQMATEKYALCQIIDELHQLIKRQHEKVRFRCFYN